MNSLIKRIAGRAKSMERRYWHDPLLSVPEFSHRISAAEQGLYGSEARSHQAIADALLFGVQYAVGAAVEGDIAEFGCMTGRTANVLAAAMASFRTTKKLHLFDSFEGLPPATHTTDTASVHVKEGVWGPGTCLGISPEALRQKCEKFLPSPQVLIYQGWFSETLKQLPAGIPFSLVHIDCDLYQSAMDVLAYYFDHKLVAEGAVIFFDDWNCNRASNQCGERKAWAEVVDRYKIEASDGGSYSWGGHKFFVHKYG